MWTRQTIEEYVRSVKGRKQTSWLHCRRNPNRKRCLAVTTPNFYTVAILKFESIRILPRNIEQIRLSKFGVRRAHRHRAGIELVKSPSSDEQERKFFSRNFFSRPVRNAP